MQRIIKTDLTRSDFRSHLNSKRITTLFITLVALSAMAVAACIAEDDLTDDQRAYQLSQQLMCPVCDGQTLDQSQAQISEDMKAVIRQKLEEGETNAQIRDYFVDRYGESVLAAPTSSGFNLLAWTMPIVIFAGGMLIVANALRNMRKQKASPKPAEATEQPAHDTDEQPQDDDDLTPYLARVETEIAALMSKDQNRTSQKE